MKDKTLEAMERLENAHGELVMAERLIGQSQSAEGLNVKDISFSDWLPLVAKGKLMDARKVTANAIQALDDARAAVHELHRMTHGDDDD